MGAGLCREVTVRTLFALLCSLWSFAVLAQCTPGQCPPVDRNPGVREIPSWYEGNEDAVSLAIRGTVRIATSRGYGSGVVIYRANGQHGYALTNHHVIAGVSVCRMEIGNTHSVPCTVESSMYAEDIALLKFDADLLPPYVRAIPIASRPPQIGERVIVLGHPNGGSLKVRSGRLLKETSKIVNVDFPQLVARSVPTWECSAQVFPGDSGGPVVNMQGELVGLVWGARGTSFLVTHGQITFFVEQKCKWLYDWISGGSQPNRNPPPQQPNQPQPNPGLDFLGQEIARLRNELENIKSRIPADRYSELDRSIFDLKSRADGLVSQISALDSEIKTFQTNTDRKYEDLDKKLATAQYIASAASYFGIGGAVPGVIALLLGASRSYLRWRAGLGSSGAQGQEAPKQTAPASETELNSQQPLFSLDNLAKLLALADQIRTHIGQRPDQNTRQGAS